MVWLTADSLAQLPAATFHTPPSISGLFSTCPALSHPTCLGPALHPLSSALSPGSWVVNLALTVHPGIRTQGANAGRGLGGVADGLAGGPSVKIDVDGHRGAGEHQEPDDGQDIGNAHKLQGAGQSRAQPWLPSGRGRGQGSARFPRQGRAWGRWGTAMLPAPSSAPPARPSVSPGRQHRTAAQAGGSCSSQEQRQSQIHTRLCVRGGDRQQQEDCHLLGRG